MAVDVHGGVARDRANEKLPEFRPARCSNSVTRASRRSTNGPQLRVLRYELGALSCQRGGGGNQPGAFSNELVIAVGTCHADILADPARSVVDTRRLRAPYPFRSRRQAGAVVATDHQ